MFLCIREGICSNSFELLLGATESISVVTIYMFVWLNISIQN